MPESSAPTVADNPAEQRYEIHVDGALMGFAAYQRTAEMVAFTHTEIDPAAGGQGLGGQLVRAALDDVRGQGLKVLPVCPFVQEWIRRHPDYADLDYRAPRGNVTD